MDQACDTDRRPDAAMGAAASGIAGANTTTRAQPTAGPIPGNGQPLRMPSPPMPAPPGLGWTLAATSLGLVVVQIDITIVNVALPHIGSQLTAGIGGLQWVVDAYTLAFAAFLLSAGALGDRLGSRGTYLLGMIVFGIASLACGIAPNTPVLIAARAFQGLGAAMVLPTSLSLIAHACGENHRARTRAIGIWSSTGGAAVAAGPVIGGFLIDDFGWRSIFLVNIPLCILAVWWTLRSVAETVKHQQRGGFDPLGQILGIITLFCLTGAVIEAGPRGWHDNLVLSGLIAAAIGGCAFIAAELANRHPMVPLGFFKRSTFSAAVLIGIISNFTFYGLIFVLSLYFQEVRHYSPAETGLAFLPLTGIFIIANIFSGWIASRIGFRWPMTGGLIVGAIGFGLLCRVGPDTPFTYMAPVLALIPIGTGTAIPAMTAAVLATVERQRAGTASAVLNTARQVGGAMGVALFGALVASQDVTKGLDDTFAISAVMLAVAGLIAYFGIKPTGGQVDWNAGAGGH